MQHPWVVKVRECEPEEGMHVSAECTWARDVRMKQAAEKVDSSLTAEGYAWCWGSEGATHSVSWRRPSASADAVMIRQYLREVSFRQVAPEK